MNGPNSIYFFNVYRTDRVDIYIYTRERDYICYFFFQGSNSATLFSVKKKSLWIPTKLMSDELLVFVCVVGLVVLICIFGFGSRQLILYKQRHVEMCAQYEHNADMFRAHMKGKVLSLREPEAAAVQPNEKQRDFFSSMFSKPASGNA